MNKHTRKFDPNGPGLDNGKLFGLPHTMAEADLWIIPVPWDTTVSYRSGTSQGPSAILKASIQVDLYDSTLINAWKPGMFLLDPSVALEKRNKVARSDAERIIQSLEQGQDSSQNSAILERVNKACLSMVQWVKEKANFIILQNKIPAILGGDHSTPLGLLQALGNRYPDFGILQIDAHMDLRKAYEGFEYSHASIMRNAIRLPSIIKLVQVGIRDYCEEEIEVIERNTGKIIAFPYREIIRKTFEGISWRDQVKTILKNLPQKVYISFDIDGLDPSLCPDTGTPVPGGLSFDQALYLVEMISNSGREIIGFDLCEVAPGENEWNAIVGARVLYRLYIETIKSKLKQESNGNLTHL